MIDLIVSLYILTRKYELDQFVWKQKRVLQTRNVVRQIDLLLLMATFNGNWIRLVCYIVAVSMALMVMSSYACLYYILCASHL